MAKGEGAENEVHRGTRDGKRAASATASLPRNPGFAAAAASIPRSIQAYGAKTCRPAARAAPDVDGAPEVQGRDPGLERAMLHATIGDGV
jgi:hypothetical protein